VELRTRGGKTYRRSTSLAIASEPWERGRLPQTHKDDALNILSMEDIEFVNVWQVRKDIVQMPTKVECINQLTLGFTQSHFEITVPFYMNVLCSSRIYKGSFLWDPTSEASVQSQGLISACSLWLVGRVLGPYVAAKNKPVRGTWVEALDMGGLEGPKRTISC